MLTSLVRLTSDHEYGAQGVLLHEPAFQSGFVVVHFAQLRHHCESATCSCQSSAAAHRARLDFWLAPSRQLVAQEPASAVHSLDKAPLRGSAVAAGFAVESGKSAADGAHPLPCLCFRKADAPNRPQTKKGMHSLF